MTVGMFEIGKLAIGEPGDVVTIDYRDRYPTTSIERETINSDLRTSQKSAQRENIEA